MTSLNSPNQPLDQPLDASREIRDGPGATFVPTKTFGMLVALVHVICFIGLALLARDSDPSTSVPETSGLFLNLMAVTLMMLVGFGYLMTFLHKYGLGAVGLTLIVTCLGVELSLILEPLMSLGFYTFELNMMSLLNGMFAAAAFLISFGGLIGKVNPAQLVVLVTLECIFYSANKNLILIKLLSDMFGVVIADVGGTITIHMFGAYFGLACAWVLGTPKVMDKEESSTTSDVTSLIGTTTLWIFWPAFVCGALPVSSAEADAAIVHTYLALVGSTLATFALSPLLHGGKLSAVDVQNATLAGGVAIGAIADGAISPAGALAVGTIAGIISVLGYTYVQPALADSKLALHDTCGIHNLHGMPSLFGGVASAVAASVIDLHGVNAGEQITGMIFTLVVAIASGLLTGVAMRPLRDSDVHMGDDSAYWHVAADFKTV